MQFKHPEVLYALFLLVIPILIHLFQLRRFKKVEFTNVKFLKTVKQQTRKSSILKKWLVLLARLLALACLIISFAQPFTPLTDDFNEAQETVIYLDNSFSMQANGNNGALLNEAIQDVVGNISDSEVISLFTNDVAYTNTTLKALKNDIIDLKYSTSQLNYKAALLKGKQLFSKNNTTTKNLILVSDFQQNTNEFISDSINDINLQLVQLKPQTINNISIDSIFTSNSNGDNIDLNILLSNSGEAQDNVSISLFNDTELLAKTATAIETKGTAVFTIPNNTVLNGKLVIDDTGLQYDNTFFFTINEHPKIKVLAINGDTTGASFLRKLYTNDEFNFNSFSLSTLNFNLIPEQNLVILNELNTISNALASALTAFKNDGGHVLIIPSTEVDLTSYNQLIAKFNVNTFNSKQQDKKLITNINYSHPLFKNTFNKQVNNFQYPKVQSSFRFNGNTHNVLSYEDGSSFLVGNNNVYVFSSALNSANSNFKNSQLIVPVLYNIGLQSLKLSQLYYTIGKPNTIAVNASLGQDEILSLNTEESSIIPLQKTYSKSVVIETDEFPNKSGILSVNNKENVLQNLSFNYNRKESNLQYHNLDHIASAELSSSLSDTLNTIKSNANVNALWKWFVIFALTFLLIEMLLLKYLK